VRTPLQIQLHLALALEAGYQTGETPLSADLIESVLSRQLDDLEPTLARHGYRIKDLVEQFDVRPERINASSFAFNLSRALFSVAVNSSRNRRQMRAATISRLKSVRNNQVVIGKINVIEPSFDIQPGGFGKYKESFVFQIGNT
jgi:hypothetical protein